MKMDEQADVELVRQFKSGNHNAFDEIVRRFQDRVYRLALVWLYDDQVAADVAQEVFIRAHQGLRKFQFRSAPFTWLYRTTKNVCREFNRVRRTEQLVDDPPAQTRDPEQQTSDSHSARRVREMVGTLPERQRDVVLLRIFEDLSVKETAKAMGCREGTVKALLHKATASLKQKENRAIATQTERESNQR